MNLKKQARRRRAMERRIKDIEAWDKLVQTFSNYTEEDIRTKVTNTGRHWKDVRGYLVQQAARSAERARMEVAILAKRIGGSHA